MGGDTGSVPFVLAMLTVTLGGIFVVATLIGVISTGIQGKLDELRRGRSIVLEDNHTVILGWSPQVFDIVSELVLANANKRNQRIVILAGKDKIEMETEIRQRLPNTLTTRIVCRSGSPIDLDDLALASLQTSRAIIVLPPETDDPDTDVIKTLLAITNDPKRRQVPYRIVTEIRDAKKRRGGAAGSGGEAQLVLGGELIGRIAAQTCRQPGFRSCTWSCWTSAATRSTSSRESSLVGRQFGDALKEFRTSSLIGLVPAGEQPRLNPPMDTVIGAEDELIFVAEDDDTIKRERTAGIGSRRAHCRVGRPFAAARRADAGAGLERPHARPADGARSLCGTRLRPCLSSPTAPCRRPGGRGWPAAYEAAARPSAPATRRIDQCSTPPRPRATSTSSSWPTRTCSTSNAQTLARLVTLLHLRDIESQRGEQFTIVTEMLDVRNRALAHVTRADDFIVSRKLVSLTMTQLAENRRSSGGLRRPVRRGRLRGLSRSRPRHYVRPNEQLVSTRWSRPPADEVRSRSATDCWPTPTTPTSRTAS